MRCIAVVATFGRVNEARGAIDALLAQTRPPDHIVLVENTPEPMMAGMYPASQVEAICTGENTGAAGGFSIGGDLALERGATHVLYVDDDCVLERRCLEVLLTKAGALPDCALGAVVVSPEGEIVWDLHRPDGSAYSSVDELPDTVIPTRELAFHALLVPAEPLRRAGGPRTDLFFGGVDIEFSLRLAAGGLPLFYCPGALATHHAVNYRHFWFLGDRKVPTGTPGHRYYVLRNRLLMWRLYRRDSFLRGVGVVTLRELVTMAFSPNRGLRTKLLARAVREAMIGDPHRPFTRDVPLHA
ncbi:MAG: glycosyltransferase [Dehalococcoidia bacterium]